MSWFRRKPKLDPLYPRGTPAWTLASAGQAVQALYGPALKAGWTLHLSGMVLVQGYTYDELNLLAVPFQSRAVDTPALEAVIWDSDDGWTEVNHNPALSSFIYRYKDLQNRKLELTCLLRA